MTRRLACVLLALLAPGLPAALADGEPAAPAPFQLRLLVASPGGARDEVVVGMAEGATDAYDRGLDRAQAPRPFGDGWVQAHAVAPATRPELARLQTSLGPVAAWMNATLRLEDGSLDGDIMISWSPEDVAALPESYAVELRAGSRVADVRAERSLTLDASGDAPLDALLRVFPLQGAPPGPPRDLRALPDENLTRVLLQWDAPREEGGAPLRGYVVSRADGAGPYRPIATVGLVQAFEDPMPPTGTLVRYAVAARSALGEGAPSNVAPLLAARSPVPLDREATPDGWTATPLADRSADVPGHEARTPAIEQGLVEARPDGDRYVLVVTMPTGNQHTLSLLTGGLVGVTVGPTLAEEQAVATPGASARAAAWHRSGADGQDVLVVLDSPAGRRAVAVPLP